MPFYTVIIITYLHDFKRIQFTVQRLHIFVILKGHI